MFQKLVINLITLYQKTLSPDHGWLKVRYPAGYCRFYPSCSQYTKQAIEKKGVFRGIGLGIKRVLRCNPFVEPMVDQI
jgi:putative membrane protein insertion efficiency factor